MKKILLIIMAITCAFGLCACEKGDTEKAVEQSAKYGDQYYFLMENGELYVSDSEEFDKDAEKIKKDEDGEKLPKFEKMVLEEETIGDHSEGIPVVGIYYITEDGDVYVIGLNTYGQLGIGHNNEVKELTKNKNVSNIKDIVWNEVSTYFIDNKGEVYASGYNEVGSLGLGHIDEVTTATKIEALESLEIEEVYTYAEGGFSYTYFVAKNGEVYACGSNENGELGIDSKYNTPGKDAKHNYGCIVTPRKVEALTGKKIKSIWAGEATLEDGTEIDLTKNIKKEDKNINSSNIEGLKNISKIVVGEVGQDETYKSTYWIDKNGDVYVSGYNKDGHLGLGHTKDVKEPTKISSLNNIKDIEVSNNLQGNTYFLTTDGEVYVAGANEYGELGVGNTNMVTIPKKVLGLDGVKIKRVINGQTCRYTTYLSEDGKVYVSGVYDSPESPEELYMLKTAVQVGELAGVKIKSITVENYKNVCIAENGDKYEIVNYGSGPVAKKI